MKKLIVIISILVVFITLCHSQNNSESDDFSYALKLYEEKFYDLSAQQFIKFANNHPSSSRLDEAGYYAGMSLFNLADYKNARIEFQSVAVNFPKSKRAPESWFMCAESYENSNSMLDAAKSYEAVKTLYPSSPKAPYATLKAGDIYVSLNNTEKADQLFSIIQDRYVGSGAYYPSLISHGKLFLLSGKISKAREKFSKILQSNAGVEIKAQANFLLGELSEQLGYTKDAQEYYTIVRKSNDKSKEYIDASYKLAKIKIQNGQYNDAKQILNDGIGREALSATKDQMNELLGDAHFLDNKFALAQKSYEKSLQESKGDVKNRRQLKNALAWYYQNNITNAISILENQINYLPDSLDIYISLSLDLYYKWLEENKNYLKAINNLNELKQTPHFSIHFTTILINFLQLNKNWAGLVRELEPEIKRSQKMNELDDYTFDLAIAYENLKDYEKSKYYYNKLLLEYPSSKYISDAKKGIEYLNNFYIQNKSMGVGQLALLIGDQLNEENKSKLKFQLGKIYFYNLIDYNAAIMQFEKALSMPENSDIKSDILYYIGKSYFNLSQLKQNSEAQKSNYLMKSKDYFSQAMENIKTSSVPDEVASALVECGILLDKPTVQKQINYYSTLLNNYSQSKLTEKWHYKLGDIYFTNSNYALAKQEFEYLINNFKSSEKFPTYLFLYANLKKLNNETPIEDYRVIAGEFPESEHAAEALYKMAEIYYNNGQFQDAGQLFNKLILEYYYTDFALQAEQYVADTYIATEKYEEAIKFYKSEISKLPLNDEVLRNQVSSNSKINALFKIGKAYFKINEWQKARVNLSSYLKLSKDKLFVSEAYLLIGDTYAKIDDIESAIDSYTKVDKNDTDNYKNALFKKGNFLLDLKKYDKAADTFSTLLKIFINEEVIAKYIIAQIKDGQITSANKAIKSFKDKYPKQFNYFAAFDFEKGEYLRINKNYNDALKSFQNIKKNYKNSDYADDAAYHEALTYITLNKQQEALDILTKFAKTYKNSDQIGAVLNTLGGIYFRSEKYESAILSFKNAEENKLDSELRKQVLSNLIKTYTYVNFWDAALALSRDYINEYPDADDIIDKKITISQAYVNLNQFDRAVELLREARTEADSEKEPEIQFYIGEAYLRAGQYENAIAEFVKIPLLSKKTKLQWEASALYYSGQAYEKMGKINEAIRMYEEIVKRPGIDLILKKDAKKRIEQIKS
jgi:TolA-binding protein